MSFNLQKSIGAAVRVGSEVYGPEANHFEALSLALENGAFPDIDNMDQLFDIFDANGYAPFYKKYDVEDGFVNERGEFMTRETALDYAKRIYELDIDSKKDWLNSEDLEFHAKKKASLDWYDIARASMLRYSAKKKTLAVDFDETIAGKAEFPKMGRPLKGA